MKGLVLMLAAVTGLFAQGDKIRVIAFGAHPDDCDIRAAGTAALFAKMGHPVKFVSVTNGDVGHQEMHGPRWRSGGSRRLRNRRGGSASRTTFWTITTDNCCRHSTCACRSFARSASGTPTSCSRRGRTTITRTTATRACWCRMRRTWWWCRRWFPRSRRCAKIPSSSITRTASSGPIRSVRTSPSILDEVIDQKIDALDAHVSQFYEWLPWVDGRLAEVPKDPAERKAWLKRTRTDPDLARRPERTIEVVRSGEGQRGAVLRGVRDLRIRRAAERRTHPPVVSDVEIAAS